MTIHALGPFRLDTQDDLLFRGDEPVALGRRAVALLRALVERPGALVSKDALIEAAWPGLAVEESNLTVQIAALRRVLGEVPGGERWIETMPRRGYRFVAPVGAQTVEKPPPPGPRAGAERRQITALSCELTGQTNDFGLEDLHEAADAFQRRASEIVERHGGFVVSRLGNAVLVLFGYPAAGEHDAEHAVRAGLELRATLGDDQEPLRCRVGIATGVAIIGDLGPGRALRDYEIVGEAPNLALRLRLSARPDIVAIDPATRRLIGDLFDCRDLGFIETTSQTEPIRVWRVEGESDFASRFEALRGPALTKLVGREEELGLLLRLWARAGAGEGQVMLVSGEAGLGKSRLTAALEEHPRTESYFRLRYFCSPHHQDSALFPFIDQLGRAAGFGRDDSAGTRLEKLVALLSRAAMPNEDVALLVDLLALPVPERPELSPARKKTRTLEALTSYIVGLARQQPMVVIFEDAHWIDATSRDLLDLIIERARDLKILLIVTFRPEFKSSWTGQPRVTMLALNRLDRQDRIALVTQVAGDKLPAAVIDQIADRTDGVPLFIEELTKTVLEADRHDLAGAIPTSLYASLLARLDRPESVRLVAQTGAAIGREFSWPLLRAVSTLPDDELRAGLARLVASELVFQRGTAPDTVYRFKHALVQDVAYGTLLRDARRQTHARIARSLETLSPELMSNQPELFARHYTEAGLTQESVTAWAKAGQFSAARSALAEAAAHYQKALDQLALLPDTQDRARQELEFRSALGALLRFLKGQAAPETGAIYARTRQLWEQLGSPPEFRQVPYGQSMYHVYRGELDQARRIGEELLSLSRQRDDRPGIVLGHSASGQSLMLAGAFAASRSHLEELIAICDPISEAAPVHRTGSHPLLTQAVLGIAQFCLGFPDQATARCDAAIADARRLAQPTYLAVGLALSSLHLSLAGDNTALMARATELLTVATEQALPFFRAWASIFRGHARIRDGGAKEGMALLRDGVTAYQATGAVMWSPHFIALLAAGHQEAGQLDEADTLLDDATRLTEETGERWFLAELHRYKGQLLMLRGRIDAAEKQYREALNVAQAQGARLWELRAAMSLSQIWRDLGRHAEARDLLAPIFGWFTEGLDTPDLKAARALLDRDRIAGAMLSAVR